MTAPPGRNSVLRLQGSGSIFYDPGACEPFNDQTAPHSGESYHPLREPVHFSWRYSPWIRSAFPRFHGTSRRDLQGQTHPNSGPIDSCA